MSGEENITNLLDVNDKSLGDIALYEHTVATNLLPHGGRPAWADDLIEAIGRRIDLSIDLSNRQQVARIQNVHCVADSYSIYPVPIACASNGVPAGAVPPGTNISYSA